MEMDESKFWAVVGTRDLSGSYIEIGRMRFSDFMRKNENLELEKQYSEMCQRAEEKFNEFRPGVLPEIEIRLESDDVSKMQKIGVTAAQHIQDRCQGCIMPFSTH